MKPIRLGVTISVRPGDQSLWENGISQNCIFLAGLFAGCPEVSRAVLVKASEEALPSDGLMLGIAGVELIGPGEAMEALDVLIEMGAQLPDEWAERFRRRGGRYVSMRVGNDFVIDAERVIFGKPPGSLCCSKTYDAVWTIPGHERICGDYFSIINRCPVVVLPHIWSPLFFQKGIETLPETVSYGYTAGRRRWRLCCFEPNINTVKTCMVPMLLSEEAYRESPAFLECLKVCNTDHIREQDFFRQFSLSLDITSHGLATYEARFHVYDFLSRYGDAVVSHQWGCPQNYLYYEVLYGRYPLIHNSELMKSCGYYYEGFDNREGARILLDAFANHDLNLEAYNISCVDLLRSVDPANPSNVIAYSDELARIVRGDGCPVLPSYEK